MRQIVQLLKYIVVSGAIQVLDSAALLLFVAFSHDSRLEETQGETMLGGRAGEVKGGGGGCYQDNSDQNVTQKVAFVPRDGVCHSQTRSARYTLSHWHRLHFQC